MDRNVKDFGNLFVASETPAAEFENLPGFVRKLIHSLHNLIFQFPAKQNPKRIAVEIVGSFDNLFTKRDFALSKESGITNVVQATVADRNNQINTKGRVDLQSFPALPQFENHIADYGLRDEIIFQKAGRIVTEHGVML